MKSALLASAVALAVTLTSSVAMADDPNDPAMRTAAARARDRETIRQLNLEQLRHVRARDAGYAEGWRAYRETRKRDDRRAAELCADGEREYCKR